MIFKLNNIMFVFVSQVKFPSSHLNRLDHISYRNFTRSSSHIMLIHSPSYKNSTRNYFFKRLSRLWNTLPQIDLSQSMYTIKLKLHQVFWNYFSLSFFIYCSLHFSLLLSMLQIFGCPSHT